MISSVLASAGAIDYGRVFADLAIILIVAKVASEFFERIHIPAVLGEIVAGIIIGPSMLGLIDPSDAMRILAAICVEQPSEKYTPSSLDSLTGDVSRRVMKSNVGILEIKSIQPHFINFNFCSAL